MSFFKTFLVGGFHPVAVDYVCAYLMGFNWARIPSIKEGFEERHFNLTPYTKEQIRIKSNANWQAINFMFCPSKGWLGEIER